MTEAQLLERQPQAAPIQIPVIAEPRKLSVVEYAMQSGASPADLRALLELQVQADTHQLAMMQARRVMDEEDRKAAALLAFRRDFAIFRGKNIVVTKDKQVDRGRAGSFMQAEYHSVASMLSPALSECGFSFRHDQKFGPKPWPLPDNPNNVVGWVWVTCYLEHKDGHAETLELEGPEGDQSANTPVQNMQATASYLKRQSLLAITGTATGGEDDEGKMRRRGAVNGGEAQAAPPELLASAAQAAAKGAEMYGAWWKAATREQRLWIGVEQHNANKAQAEAADRARTAD